MQRFYYGFTLLVSSVGCVSPAAGPSPDIPQPSVPVASPTPKSWTLTPDERVHSYVSRAFTAIELQQEAGVVRDSFLVTMGFSIRAQRTGNLPRIAGILDHLQREPGNRPLQPEQATTLPLSFSGHVDSGGLVLDSVGDRTVATVADCENPGLNQINVVQRNLFLAPLTLTTGTRWTDSSTVSMCSGTVPVELTSVRTYTVTGEAQESGSAAIMIERLERTKTTGEGSQGQHRIGLQAAGTGSAQLYLEPASGLLRVLNGQSRTVITIRSSGRLQQFVQVVKKRTTRVR